ncbi:hypothetical protein [Paenibacillus dendritiformis]|uniref:hypothetical protein n=1 Tax=Paenibacillus dendritiformis TaxID=130049 RepID=UPI0018CDCEE6|nr:hypothetical protein [Paenibacillus dendritiformis]
MTRPTHWQPLRLRFPVPPPPLRMVAHSLHKPAMQGPLLKALIGGIALQALLDPDYPVDEVYRDAEVWLRAMLDNSLG